MTTRKRLWPGALFFALMFGHWGVNAYSVWLDLSQLPASTDGWTARLLPDSRAEIASVDQGGPATVLRQGDELVSINGRTLQDDPKLLSYNQGVPPNKVYKMVVRRQGQLLEFDLATVAYPLRRWLAPIGNLLVPLLFLLTGLIVFLLKSADRQAWLLSLMLGAFTGLFNSQLPPLPFAALALAAVARVVGIMFLPIFCYFFLIFPERSPLLRRFPNLERWLYWPAYAALPWFALARLQVVFRANESVSLFLKNSWLLKSRAAGLLSLAIALTYLASGLAALFIGYRVAGVAARRKLHVIAAGSGAGFFNLLLLIVWEVFFWDRLPQARGWIEFGLQFTLPLIPLSFAYAIIRHQVIPVSLIIRRGVRYVLVSRGSIILGGLIVGLTITVLLSTIFNWLQPPPVVNGVVSAIVGIIAYNLYRSLHRRYLAPVIDRRFFRQSYDTHQIIADLTESLRSTTSLDHLLELVATKIQAALQTENVTVFLRNEASGDCLCAYSCEYSRSDGRTVTTKRECRLPHYAWTVKRLSDNGMPMEVEPLLDVLPEDGREGMTAAELETLREVKSSLLLPLLSKDEMLGVVSLGPRLGDLPYSREDEKLLMSVAGPATFAIENARLVERMIAEARRRQELEAENEQRMKELEEARHLQLSMLPKSIPQLPHIEIAAYMKTATEVGGDYYDFHLSDDGTLTVAVGDATGHGLKAGTVVTATKSLFNHLARNQDIVEIFSQSSQSLKRMNFRGLFMAMIMVKVNGRQLTISSAGMPPILIYRERTGEVEELFIKGVPLGSVNGYRYDSKEITLSDGDVVVMMSDGFPERFNRAGEMLGYTTAKGVLSESASLRAQAIIERFVKAGDDWAEGLPQDDDATFAVLKVKKERNGSDV